jgi:hypothetical protein
VSARQGSRLLATGRILGNKPREGLGGTEQKCELKKKSQEVGDETRDELNTTDRKSACRDESRCKADGKIEAEEEIGRGTVKVRGREVKGKKVVVV